MKHPKIITQQNPLGMGWTAYDDDEATDTAEDFTPLSANGKTEADAIADFREAWYEREMEREAERDCKRAVAQAKVWDQFLGKLFG